MAVVVVTTEPRIARQTSCIYGTVPLLLKEVVGLPQLQEQVGICIMPQEMHV